MIEGRRGMVLYYYGVVSADSSMLCFVTWNGLSCRTNRTAWSLESRLAEAEDEETSQLDGLAECELADAVSADRALGEWDGLAKGELLDSVLDDGAFKGNRSRHLDPAAELITGGQPS